MLTSNLRSGVRQIIIKYKSQNAATFFEGFISMVFLECDKVVGPTGLF